MVDADAIPTDLREKLDEFDASAEKVIATFLVPLDAQPAPATIYHYTNDVGLKGILESGKIWLSDIFNLNDPSEVRHGFSHVVKILGARAANGPKISKLFAKSIDYFAQQGFVQAAAHYFVCSFSSAGDDLGQWRAYADNGRGFALGFDGEALEKAYTKIGEEPIPYRET
jgi:hypothetical protein